MEETKSLQVHIKHDSTNYKIEFARSWNFLFYKGGYVLTIYKKGDDYFGNCHTNKLIEVTLDVKNKEELINCENKYSFLKNILTDYLGIQCWREFIKFLIGYSTLILDTNKHLELVEYYENVIEYNEVYLSEEELNCIVQDSIFNRGIETFHQEELRESEKIEVEIPKKPLITKGEFYNPELYWDEKEHQIIQPLEPIEEKVLVVELPKEEDTYKIKPLHTE